MMPEKKVINLSRIDLAINVSEAADVPVLLTVHEARFLLNQAKRAAMLEAQRRTWASHINRMSVIMMDCVDLGNQEQEFAQGMQLMVLPFLEGQNHSRCQYCGKYNCRCVRQTGG